MTSGQTAPGATGRGTRDGNKERQIPADNPWRQRFRELAGTSKHVTIAKTMSPDPALNKSLATTVARWRHPSRTCPEPNLTSILRVAAAFDYTVIEQLYDLGYITGEDLALVDSPLLTPNWLLFERLERVIVESHHGTTHITDLIAAVQRSSLETGDLARWRAKVFEVKSGMKYEHIGFHAVEFEAWLGPNPPETAEERLKLRHAMAEAVLKDLVPSPARRYRLMGGRTIEEMGLEAYVAKLERTELIERFGHVRSIGHLISYGDGGTLAGPLLGLDDPGMRHVYVEPVSAGAAGDRVVKGFAPAREAFGGSDRVLLVAPAAASAASLGHLVGRALGWPVTTLRESAGLSGGNTVLIRNQQGNELVLARAARAFRTSSVRAREILVVTQMKHLKGVEGRRLLLDPRLFVVMLRPGFTTLTLHAWADRQKKGQGISKANSAEAMDEDLDTIEATILSRETGGFRVFDIQEDLEWWPAPVPDLTTGAGVVPERADYFEHPGIGDIRVEAAYQLATFLASGKMPYENPARIRFLDGPVARYREDLRASRSGPLRVKAQPTRAARE
ncbi:hypothetical protein SPF06_19650 [Sinomonas sp. JGH33]|uniref:Uncharacterized protein n=1 Tax=Sinomonas terricola TaxID=3110330 RepID=A0ABU5TB85_9MICC|nr:hypothetical protein [Sinomonas sp. JGH33]MEA5456943.1 hypothetical protein [Sinomonas sp. JGH33]